MGIEEKEKKEYVEFSIETINYIAVDGNVTAEAILEVTQKIVHHINNREVICQGNLRSTGYITLLLLSLPSNLLEIIIKHFFYSFYFCNITSSTYELQLISALSLL
jgi:hypothetical protein